MPGPRADPVGRPERSDAARNRARVLAAAERLFAERGADGVSMEDIALAAGVGKGTLYRRYPDRAAVAVSLLAEHERRLREQVVSGPPPLGPGAAPAQRLDAFFTALVELLDQHLDLAVVAESGAARFRTDAYDCWRSHVGALLAAAGMDDPDGVLTELLLAPLAVDLHRHLAARGVTVDQLSSTLRRLMAGLLPS